MSTPTNSRENSRIVLPDIRESDLLATRPAPPPVRLPVEVAHVVERITTYRPAPAPVAARTPVRASRSVGRRTRRVLRPAPLLAVLVAVAAGLAGLSGLGWLAFGLARTGGGTGVRPLAGLLVVGAVLVGLWLATRKRCRGMHCGGCSR